MIICDACGTTCNTEYEAVIILDDGTRLCEDCEEERQYRGYDEDIDNIMRISPYWNVKELL